MLCSFCVYPTIRAGAQTEWTYDTPIEAASRPAWMERVVMICESPWADGSRKALKPHVQALKDAGFTLMNMYPDGFCRLHPPEAGETWPAECRAEVAAMHAAGMKALAGVYPFVGSRGPSDLLTKHPEWRLRADDKTPEAPGLGCLLSPFGDALIERLVARVKEFDIDGFQFDGWYQSTYCRCESCKSRYKAEAGLDLPPKADTRDPAYLRYMVWRDKRLLDRFVQLRKAVKQAKPDAVLVNWNNNDAAGNYPSWMPEALNCLNDWTNKEWWDTFDDSAVWLIKRLCGSAGDRPAGVQPYMFMRHGLDIQSGVYHGSSCPITEVLYRAHKVMAMGSIPIIWPGARQGWTTSDSAQVSQALADFLPTVHQTRTLPYAACIDSYTTLQMAKIPPAEAAKRVGSHRFGMARALLEEHIPFDVLSEHNLTAQSLARYKVVILPNNACMPDRLVKLLRDFVAAGGGVVASFETSLYDGWGERRPDFALGDLFRASYGSSAAVSACRIRFSTAAHPVTDSPALKSLMGAAGYTTYAGAFARVTALPQSIAPLTALDVVHEKDSALKDWQPLLLSEHGAGRVAYFPAAMDAAYYEAGYPYERLLLANAVRWAAKQPPPVQVTAPMCVQASFFTKEQGSSRQTIVHLLNTINSTTGNGSQQEKEYAIREEVVPIAGVRVTFAGARPERAYAVPGRAPLALRAVPTGWEATLPELGQHAAVVAEYPVRGGISR